jgi:hypothetical protein
MKSLQVQFGFEGKVIEMSVAFEQFELNISTQGGEEMVGLGGHGLGRRLLQRGILLEGLVLGFHIPSFVIEGGHAITSQGRIAGDQIQAAGRAIFVCEDLLDEKKRKGDFFHIDQNRLTCFKIQRVDSLVTARPLLALAHGDFAIGFERHDELLFERAFEEFHIFGGGKPNVVEHIGEHNLVLDRLANEIAIDLIAGPLRMAFFFAILGIGVHLGLGHKLKAHRQGQPLAVIEATHKVNALDRTTLRMIVMPADNLVDIRVRLFGNTIVNNEYPFRTFDLAHMRLDDPPQIGRALLFCCQKPLHRIVADFIVQQRREAGGRGLPKRTDQVITIQVK